MLVHPVAHTTEGTVRGLLDRGLAVFRGIRYAQPPVGPLRFAAPVPPEPWDGVREAFEFGPTVPQSGPLPAEAAEGSRGTDWLTLNVCTPHPDRTGLPVLVWIHGGGYMSGTAADPLYDPVELARHGLVVVSINYRVGAEGFALLEGAPANRAFLDQIAALEWVQRNIARFGGDPDRVTIAGQSAGAGSVAALLTMDKARGLFRRAIAHSVPGNLCTPALAAEVTAELAKLVGTAPTAAALAEVAPWTLAAAVTDLGAELPRHLARWGRLAQAGIATVPVVDGEVLPGAPWSVLASGRVAGVDLLVGHTRDEFRLFGVLSGRHGTFTDEEAGLALDLLAPAPSGPDRYRAAHPGATASDLLETVSSDALFRMPSLRLAEANSAAGGTSYLVELAYPAPAMGGLFGACHGLDVPLAFGSLDSPIGRHFLGEPPAPEAVRLSRELQQGWVRFVTTGDPGWAAFDPEQQLTRVLDARSETVRYPEQASREIWAGHPLTAYDLG
ncbi:carboxylesterase type B [Streptomyces sp. 1114.5]|uniref:carboxylesterase/lipase family protein n=1 Tax=unclassified Streptomyces TaxID=2593676 RepID=UPI000BDCD8ED|nr:MULTISPECIES: carboxylesterase family protein [unclassified Streptomyces]RKT19785.1 carboxylesterase type B [Streptomyces sp. 1114.5]SOB85984.1 para-nitrobenzyl esterase [Streptomyces sp. 1331.2]